MESKPNFTQIEAESCFSKPWKFITQKQDAEGKWAQFKETSSHIDGNGEMELIVDDRLEPYIGGRNGVTCANSIYCRRG